MREYGKTMTKAIQMTAEQIRNLNPTNLKFLLKDYSVAKVAEMCGVSDRGLRNRIKEYRLGYILRSKTTGRTKDRLKKQKKCQHNLT